MVTIDEYPAFGRWYKFDIHIDWSTNTYYVMQDDSIVADAQSFIGHSLDMIQISVNRAVDVWFDEIYVGFDNTMKFKCPSTSRKGARTVTPVQQSW